MVEFGVFSTISPKCRPNKSHPTEKTPKFTPAKPTASKNPSNLDDIVEVGYNETPGFVWLKQKKSKVHGFRAIGRSVSYDGEVTAFVDDRRMMRLTGVKSKELLIWVTISDIRIQDPISGKVVVGTPNGISRLFPVSAFGEEK
ncbi:unnamed protein product [Fraxinus pennsylvanica]|uniref:Uncharacterized protein n=1 Tax=Fraxinus pennsylvanica TaxID=56036 RepID=A0AAD2EBP8_9LAMI|nr:unnamed protein product [Fraxinus pennsylvanica]